ncbi:hypothetical protein Bhyg_12209, partial [Pseudolycoriella hygida]
MKQLYSPIRLTIMKIRNKKIRCKKFLRRGYNKNERTIRVIWPFIKNLEGKSNDFLFIILKALVANRALTSEYRVKQLIRGFFLKSKPDSWNTFSLTVNPESNWFDTCRECNLEILGPMLGYFLRTKAQHSARSTSNTKCNKHMARDSSGVYEVDNPANTTICDGHMAINYCEIDEWMPVEIIEEVLIDNAGGLHLTQDANQTSQRIMYSRNTIFPILFILFMVLYTTNSFVIDFQENISDEDKTSLTVRENAVVLDSLVGDTNVTIPEMLDNARRKNTQNGKKLFRKLTSFGRSNNRRIRSNEYKSSIECRDEALRISTGINEINRNWEVFFLRNTLRNTNDVWFCCYVMEYMASLSTKISEKCNSQLDVRHFVLRTDEEIRACQMFEFNSLECFFVLGKTANNML